MAESAESPKAYMTPSSVTDSSKRKSEKMHDAMTLATWVGNRPRLLNFKPKKNHTKYEVRAGNSKHPLMGAAVSGLGAKIRAEMVFLFAKIEAEILSEGDNLKDLGVWKWISDKRTKNQAKTDKTEHEMEKHGKDKVKSKPKSIEVKVNPDKVKAKKSSSQRKYNFRDQICQTLKLYNKDKYYKD
ncbi:hypothetical protein Tco_0599990 [Tanacetum coccineum]|uniref:Uncharacterized protein n=1 Tax=Tanacetum coccineum TaxID=301880 RepID=A0ABQ4WAF8_9ASTR